MAINIYLPAAIKNAVYANESWRFRNPVPVEFGLKQQRPNTSRWKPQESPALCRRLGLPEVWRVAEMLRSLKWDVMRRRDVIFCVFLRVRKVVVFPKGTFCVV